MIGRAVIVLTCFQRMYHERSSTNPARHMIRLKGSIKVTMGFDRRANLEIMSFQYSIFAKY